MSTYRVVMQAVVNVSIEVEADDEDQAEGEARSLVSCYIGDSELEDEPKLSFVESIGSDDEDDYKEADLY